MSSEEHRARLSRLPAKHIAAVFEELAARLRRREPAPLPRMTLDIGPRTIERCELLATTEDRDAMTLLVTGGDGYAAMDVTYVPVAAIRAVTIHCTSETLHHLGFGALRVRSGDAPPSPLELKRRAAAIGEELALGHPIAFSVEAALFAGDGETLADAADLLSNLRTALLTIASDADGKEALSKLERIELSGGRSTSISVEGAVLRVSVAAEQGVLEVLAVDALVSKIESVI